MGFALFATFYTAALLGDCAGLNAKWMGFNSDFATKVANTTAMTIAAFTVSVLGVAVYEASRNIKGPVADLDALDFAFEVRLTVGCGLILIMRAITLFALGCFIAAYVVCATALNMWLRAPVAISVAWLGAIVAFFVV